PNYGRRRVRDRSSHLLCCRWIYEANRRPRLAALPENRPRRNQVAPVCPLIVAAEDTTGGHHHVSKDASSGLADAVPDPAQPRDLSARCMSRSASRFAISRRLSRSSLPRASASSTLARPFLKYSFVGTSVSPRCATFPAREASSF